MQFLNTTPIQRSILDELSDGQWHPLSKISNNIDRGSMKAKDFKIYLNVELDKLVDEKILLSGNNESYRFISRLLESWRLESDNPKIDEKQYKPRYFGGILEDDGWGVAPLKFYDLVHFKADSSLSRKKLHEIIGGRLDLIQVEDGLYRIFSNDGESTANIIRELKETSPSYEISGMRTEKQLRRRDLKDLDSRYFSDLCDHYGRFSNILLRPYRTSINKHLPDSDDVQQQIYIWIIDAILRYDNETSIPFAAYLGTSLKNWVFNLNRKAYGRSAADAELKHNRATSAFKIEHKREPRVEELAEILNEDITATKRDAAVINTVVNLRNISTIHTEEADIPIASTHLVHDNIDKLVNNTLLSAAIVTACAEDTSQRKDVDLNALIGIYYTSWGPEASNKKIKTWMKTPKIQDSMKRVLELTAKKLRKN